MYRFCSNRWLVLFTAMLLILALTSCSRTFGGNENKQQSQNQQQQKKDPPSALTEMEKQTDSMIKQVQKVRDQRARMIRLQSSTSQEKKNEKQQTLPSINWQDFEKNIKSINELWNEYEPHAKKDGAPDMLISKFEEQLNKLTGSIMEQNENAVLLSANDLYQYYSQFLNLYSHKSPPEVKQIKYFLQQVLIYAEEGDWNKTPALLRNMENTWQTAKSRMEKPDKELNEKIDFAVHDFSQAVRQKNIYLSRLKGEILFKNIEKIK